MFDCFLLFLKKNNICGKPKKKHFLFKIHIEQKVKHTSFFHIPILNWVIYEWSEGKSKKHWSKNKGWQQQHNELYKRGVGTLHTDFQPLSDIHQSNATNFTHLSNFELHKCIRENRLLKLFKNVMHFMVTPLKNHNIWKIKLNGKYF